MKMAQHNSPRGFTLIELMVATSLGLIVILTMASMFRIGMNTTFTVTQRAELQQNMRTAIEMMSQDISHAGAGLPTGGMQLATAGVSNYACNQSGTCYVQTHAYPNNVGTGISNYMYGILPGYGNGVQNGTAIPNASSARNDSVTVVYQDYTFPLSNFTFQQVAGSNTQVRATLNTCSTVCPTPGYPMDILAAGGLNVGDVLFFYVSQSGTAAGNANAGTAQVQTAAVTAEITGISGTYPGPWTITFATGDPLNMNQTTGSNTMASSFSAAGQMVVWRLNVVTYFIQVPPAGGTVQTPRLMRQVNGLNAVPVADGVLNLQFSYDVIDAFTGYLSANLPNPIASGQSPGLIQKVNIWIMGESLTSGAKKSQSMYLITSVAARDMSFCNSYSYSTTACAND